MNDAFASMQTARRRMKSLFHDWATRLNKKPALAMILEHFQKRRGRPRSKREDF
jgi:hypothetical protein